MRPGPRPPLARSLLELSAVCDSDPRGGSPRPGTQRIHFVDHVQSLLHAAKDNMLVVQPLGFTGADEELGSIGVGSSVGHGQDPRSSVLQFEVLIRKHSPVDRLPSRPVVVREVATLAHELRDHSVESGSLVTEPMFPRAQRPEVFYETEFCVRFSLFTSCLILLWHSSCCAACV